MWILCVAYVKNPRDRSGMIRKHRMKFMGTLVAAASLSLVAAAPAPAGAGEWDYKGSSGFYEVNGTFYSNNVSSGVETSRHAYRPRSQEKPCTGSSSTTLTAPRSTTTS